MHLPGEHNSTSNTLMSLGPSLTFYSITHYIFWKEGKDEVKMLLRSAQRGTVTVALRALRGPQGPAPGAT